MATQVLRSLIKKFIEKHLKIYGESRATFFEEKLAEYSRGMQTAARELQEFKQKNALVNVDEQIRLLLQRRDNVEEALRVAKLRIDELGPKIVSLEELKQKLPPNDLLPEIFATNKSFGEQRQLELQLKEQELLQKYHENSRLVAEVRRSLRDVKAHLERQDRRLTDRFGGQPNKMYWELAVEITRLRSELGAAMSGMREAEAIRQTANEKMRSLDLHKRELQELEDRLAVKRNQYRVYLAKLEEAKISEALDGKKLTNVRVIQEPALAPRSFRTAKLVKVVLAGLLGLVVALGLVFFREYRRRVFYTPQSVEARLGVPVLATIPAA
jgi:uncharacterized protein involved in exopolysaccharide biosynthesis